jgi:hypothetical protein
VKLLIKEPKTTLGNEQLRKVISPLFKARKAQKKAQ